jgi:hypothetical protein
MDCMLTKRGPATRLFADEPTTPVNRVTECGEARRPISVVGESVDEPSGPPLRAVQGYSVKSTTAAPGAFVFTDSIPLWPGT